MALPYRKLGFSALVRDDLPYTAVVALEGPLDATTAPSLVEGLTPLREAGILRYVLDLRAVPYLASICDGVLINLSDDVRQRGGCVIMTNVNSNIRVILGMLGWGQFWELANTVEDALKLLRQRDPVS